MDCFFRKKLVWLTEREHSFKGNEKNKHDVCRLISLHEVNKEHHRHAQSEHTHSTRHDQNIFHDKFITVETREIHCERSR